MTTTQKTLTAALVVFVCTASVTTYFVRQVKARGSSARVAVNAPRVTAAPNVAATEHGAQIKEAPQILAPNETRLHHRIDDVSFTLSNGKLSRLSDNSGNANVIALTAPP